MVVVMQPAREKVAAAMPHLCALESQKSGMAKNRSCFGVALGKLTSLVL